MKTFPKKSPRPRDGARRQRRNRRRPPDLRRRATFETLESRAMLSVNVLTWHDDIARTGLNQNETMLTPSNVGSGTFGELLSYPVQGQVYAQPLYVSNLAIPGKGTHNVLFVVTENNDVYAFDANSNAGASAGLLWHVNLGMAAAMPNNFFGNRYGAYHDINPQVGITSTPVIDLATNTMYLDAFTNDVAGQNSYSHHIHALDITTGADKVTPVLVAASVNGNGNGGNGTTVPFVATQQLQRPALTLLNGMLYVAYSGYADTDPYHGWILGFNPANLQLLSALNTTPNLLPGGTENTGGAAGEGGIWMTGAGPASDGTNMFLLVGNGDFGTAQGDYGDSALKISTDSSTPANQNINGYGLKVADYFTPFNQMSLANSDEDLGSGGGIVLPNQPGPFPHEYIGSGKSGVIYVINRDNMGGYNALTDSGRIIQEVNLGSGNWDTAAYFNETVYYHGVNDVLKAYTLSNGLLSAAPSAQSTVSYSGSGQGASPSISANGTANGIVWDIQFSGSHEVLHAYDATTLQELYNTSQNAARDQLGAGVKFITPTIADGEVFVGGTGFVNVYGLLAPPTSPPAAPSNLAAAALSASQVQLTWVNNANNQAGFKIERSTDGTNFTQIAVAGASALSYIDMTASPNTTYYYQIRATNVIGDSAYAGPVLVTTPAVTGAVDLYHFDAGSGTSVVDSVGTNNGTLVGNTNPTWVAGKIGPWALNFTGDGVFKSTTPQSAVQTASDLSPVLGATATLTAWIKTTQLGNNTLWSAPAITGVEQSGASNDIRYGYIDAAGHIGVGAGNTGVVSTSVVSDGTWHHVAFTRDSTTGLCQVYVDGVLQASVTSDTGNKTSVFKLIGAQSVVASDGVTSQGATYFNGSLDDVRIYNQVLTANDIKGIALVPGAPTITTITANPGPVVHLAWTTPSIYTQSVEIDRKTGASGTYAAIATAGGGVTSYDDQTVAAGMQYYYVVKAIDLAGTSPSSNEVNITVPMPMVVANSVFYNGSVFDGFNGSSNQTDTTSVPTNKQALLPGETATFQNVTSYSKGINGIIVDVANFYNLPRFEDYAWQVSTDGVNWTAAPTPSIINVYPGRGPSGSTQITMIWGDNLIQNEWLQVTVLANAHTGLPSNDVFYYGNLIGATGANVTSNSVTVGSTDVTSITGDPHSLFSKASITNVNDINRDGQVNANDAVLARSNAGNTLVLFSAPSTGGGLAAPAAIAAPATTSTESPSRPGAVSAKDGMANIQISSTMSSIALPNISRTPFGISLTPSGPADPPAHGSISPLAASRAVIVAAWNTLNDANRASTWRGSGGVTMAAGDSLDELLALLATG
jgi:hypothetical protein